MPFWCSGLFAGGKLGRGRGHPLGRRLRISSYGHIPILPPIGRGRGSPAPRRRRGSLQNAHGSYPHWTHQCGSSMVGDTDRRVRDNRVGTDLRRGAHSRAVVLSAQCRMELCIARRLIDPGQDVDKNTRKKTCHPHRYPRLPVATLKGAVNPSRPSHWIDRLASPPRPDYKMLSERSTLSCPQSRVLSSDLSKVLTMRTSLSPRVPYASEPTYGRVSFGEVKR